MVFRKSVLVLSIVSIMLGAMFAGRIQVFADSGDTTVYLTKGGERYHSSECSSLRKSKIPTTLQDAVDKGYIPCSKCNPGNLDATSTSSAAIEKSTTTVVNNTTESTVVDDAVEVIKNY